MPKPNDWRRAYPDGRNDLIKRMRAMLERLQWHDASMRARLALVEGLLRDVAERKVLPIAVQDRIEEALNERS